MDNEKFWALIDSARRAVSDRSDAEAVASQATALLSGRADHEIAAAQQAFWNLMADSYTIKLWGAAYEINGGCSDDMFDYFRGWLVLQGRATFERIVADPDHLADLPEIQAAAAKREDVECETALSIAWTAHEAATGTQMPHDAFTIRYPDLEPGWDFDDQAEMRRQLPRLTALYAE